MNYAEVVSVLFVFSEAEENGEKEEEKEDTVEEL